MEPCTAGKKRYFFDISRSGFTTRVADVELETSVDQYSGELTQQHALDLHQLPHKFVAPWNGPDIGFAIAGQITVLVSSERDRALLLQNEGLVN